MNCKNCNQNVDGNFCSNCGQSVKVGKITWVNFFNELSTSIFQVNKGFFYSLKVLFTNPGNAIRAYINGKRKKHFKPIAYVFTLSTIYFLLAQFLGSATFLNDAISGYASGETSSEIEAKHLKILNFFAKNYAYTILLLLPFFSLASYLAFFKSKYNYLEHFILNAYITGQQAIFYAISAVLGLVINEDILAAATVYLSMFYTFFVFWQFFTERRKLSIILRTILTYLLYLVIVLLFTFLIFTFSNL